MRIVKGDIVGWIFSVLFVAIFFAIGLLSPVDKPKPCVVVHRCADPF